MCRDIRLNVRSFPSGLVIFLAALKFRKKLRSVSYWLAEVVCNVYRPAGKRFGTIFVVGVSNLPDGEARNVTE